MTRINDRLLIQRADDLIVFIDESSGAEFTLTLTEATRAAGALRYLTAPHGITLEQAADHLGHAVTYQPYPGADTEHGIITSVGASLVFVRYGTDTHSKGTPAHDLHLLT